MTRRDTFSPFWLAPVAAALLGSVSSVAMADCVLALSNPDIDFGTLDRANLETHAGEVTLGKRTFSLDLQCASPRDLRVFYRGAAIDARSYGLGGAAYYTLWARDALLDGKPVLLGLTGAAGELPVVGEPALAWLPHRGLMPLGAGRVLAGKHLRAQVDLIARAPYSALSVRDDTTWQAQGAIDEPLAHVTRGITVRAATRPVSCEPTLSGNGRVDFGVRSSGEFSRRSPTPLPERSLALNILCDGPARFALRVLDNRDGTASGTGKADFGLGLSGTRPVGRYTMTLSDIRVDRWSAAYPTSSADNGLHWFATQSGATPLTRTHWVGFTRRAGNGSGPEEARQVGANLTITPFIAPLDALDVRAPITLDGSATVEIVYL